MAVKKYTTEELDQFHDDMKRMEDLLKVYRSEYNMFFAGARKFTPDFTEARIRQIIKDYQGGTVLRKPSARFRFFNLVARFNTFREMFGRKVRMIEGVTVYHPKQSAEQAGQQAPTPAPVKQHRATEAPVSCVLVGTDSSHERGKVRRMFESYAARQLETGTGKALTFEKFQKQIRSFGP